VARFISPPPAPGDDFERFIAWPSGRGLAGTYVCFSVTLLGFDTAKSVSFQFGNRRYFKTAEGGGFVSGSSSGVSRRFEEGAHLVLIFVFETIGARRLEAEAG